VTQSDPIFELKLEIVNRTNSSHYIYFSLTILQFMDVKLVGIFGDFLLIKQQVATEFQYLKGSLNIYFNACLDIIISFIEFQIWHIQRHDIIRKTCWLNRYLPSMLLGITFPSKKSIIRKGNKSMCVSF
jgi:hypothetical protein